MVSQSNLVLADKKIKDKMCLVPPCRQIKILHHLIHVWEPHLIPPLDNITTIHTLHASIQQLSPSMLSYVVKVKHVQDLFLLPLQF